MSHAPEPPITIALDLDDTILGTDCFDPEHIDHNQKPIGNVVQNINSIRALGVRVVIFTSRKSSGRDATIAQLRRFGINYDDIIFDKPQFDVFLDNKAMKFQGTWDADATDDLLSEAVSNRNIDRDRYPTYF